MKIIETFSGGLDSATLLYKLRAEGHDVKCLSVDYGQRHVRELQYAGALCSALGVEHRIADLRSLSEFLKGSSQSDPSVEVPEGHYAEESMKLTIVPNRNMILLSIATAWAASSGSDAVAYAAHAGDHAIYPDCRQVFMEALGKAIGLSSWTPIQLLGPFAMMTKAEIVKLGSELGVPFALTWSCYKGGELHCGKCGTDVERKEAFRLAEIPDPTRYEDEEGAYR